MAYHLYHADTELFPKAENLRAFHADFPAWPSENNFAWEPDYKLMQKPPDKLELRVRD